MQWLPLRYPEDLDTNWNSCSIQRIFSTWKKKLIFKTAPQSGFHSRHVVLLNFLSTENMDVSEVSVTILFSNQFIVLWPKSALSFIHELVVILQKRSGSSVTLIVFHKAGV
jgi:hypothetical protein